MKSLLALLSLLPYLGYAQVSSSGATTTQDDGLCACNPRVYELTLDFNKTCEPIAVDFSTSGILDATCLVTGHYAEVDDQTPVSVSSIQFVEIGQDGAPISVAEETGEFLDGSTVSYTSVSFEGAVHPRAFQTRMRGKNPAGEELVMQWAITFSNDCEAFPILRINDSVGWAVFSGLADPLEQVCPDVVSGVLNCPPESKNCTDTGTTAEEEKEDNNKNNNEAGDSTDTVSEEDEHQDDAVDPNGEILLDTATDGTSDSRRGHHLVGPLLFTVTGSGGLSFVTLVMELLW